MNYNLQIKKLSKEDTTQVKPHWKYNEIFSLIDKENTFYKEGLENFKKRFLGKNDLDFMKELAGSYEALFSKRAIKYTSLGLKEKNLSEQEMRQFILDEYTFLKRPVRVDGKHIFIGKLEA